MNNWKSDLILLVHYPTTSTDGRMEIVYFTGSTAYYSNKHESPLDVFFLRAGSYNHLIVSNEKIHQGLLFVNKEIIAMRISSCLDFQNGSFWVTTTFL